MSNSVRPHRWQPTRLPRPWDSPGKNTGVGCHFLLQCMKVKSESEVAQSCPTRSNPMDCSLPGSSAHGIFQARVLEWGAIAFSMKVYSVPQTLMYKILVVCLLVAQSCLILCDPMDCSSPGFSVHGILQARMLEWVAIPFSKGIFPTQRSNLGLLNCKHILYHLSHQESPIYIHIYMNR